MCRVTVANPDSGRQAKRRQKNQPGERIASQLLSPKGGEIKKTQIIFCGKKATLVCDEKCHKAWGINGNGNFFKRLFCKAPDDSGTYEAGQGKTPGSHNKWCARECERSELKEGWI